MNRAEVIALAHESDEYTDENGTHIYAFTFDELKRAFEAVAAREREAMLDVIVGCPGLTVDQDKWLSRTIRARSNEGVDHG